MGKITRTISVYNYEFAEFKRNLAGELSIEAETSISTLKKLSDRALKEEMAKLPEGHIWTHVGTTTTDKKYEMDLERFLSMAAEVKEEQ